MSLGQTSVEIRPDFSRFLAELKNGVGGSLDKVAKDAERTGERIEDAFSEAAESTYRDINGRLRDANGRFIKLGEEAESAANKMERSFKDSAADSEKAIGKIGGGLAGIGAKLGAALAAAGIGLFLKGATQEAEDANRAIATTAQLIESTGGKAGVTQQQIEALSTSMRLKIGIDDTDVIKASNVLLTFTQVTGDVFDETITRAADMSAVFGTDLQGATMQLGKALNDPIKGLTALSRSGVSFTKEQKEQIKTMTEAGDVAGAQRLILDELAVQFGGTAEASASSTARISAAFGELKEGIGAGLIAAIDQVTPALLAVATSLEGPMTALGEILGDFAAPLMEILGPAAATIIPAFGKVLEVLGATISALMPVVEPLLAIFAMLVDVLAGAFMSAIQALSPVIAIVAEFLGSMGDALGESLGTALELLVPILTSVGQVFGDVLAAVLPVVLDLFYQLTPIITALAGVIGSVVVPVIEVLGSILATLAPILEQVLLQTLQAIIPIVQTLGDVFVSLLPSIQVIIEAALSIVQALLPIIPIVGRLIGKLLRGLAPVLPLIAEAIGEVANMLATFLTDAIEQLLPVVSSLIDQFVAALVPILPILVNLLMTMLDAFLPLLPVILNLVSSLLPPLVNLLGSLLPVITTLAPLIADIAKVFADLLARALNEVASILTTVLGALEPLFAFVSQIITLFADSFVPVIVDQVIPALEKVWGWIKDKVVPIFGRIIEVVADVARTVGEKISEIVGFVTGLPERLLNSLKSLASAGTDLGKGFINAFMNALKATGGFAADIGKAIANAIIDAINWAAQKVNDFIPNSLGFGPVSVDLPDDPIKKIPRLANGAIVNGAQFAMIGEAGPEAVIPLGRPTRALELLEASGLATLARNTGGPMVNIERATFASGTDADVVAQRVYAAYTLRSYAA